MKVKVTFQREARVTYVGTIIVEVPDCEDPFESRERAENEAEDLLMQGRVNFEPLLADAEFGDAATISNTRVLDQGE